MRSRFVRPGAAAAVAAVVLVACSTIKTENRVTVDPIEIKPITLNVNATIDLIVQMKEEAGRTLDMIRGGEPTSLLRPLYEALWPFAATPAFAEESAEESEEDAAYRAALRRSQGRWPQVARWFDRGCVGWNNRALLEARPCGDLSDTDARALRALVADENRDYETVYAGRIREKDLDADASVVYRVQLAQEGRERARTGHWIQLPSDRREFLNFKNTPLGEHLLEAVEAPTPGGWYRIP